MSVYTTTVSYRDLPKTANDRNWYAILCQTATGWKLVYRALSDAPTSGTTLQRQGPDSLLTVRDFTQISPKTSYELQVESRSTSDDYHMVSKETMSPGGDDPIEVCFGIDACFGQMSLCGSPLIPDCDGGQLICLDPNG